MIETMPSRNKPAVSKPTVSTLSRTMFSFVPHVIVEKLRAEGTIVFLGQIPDLADMYSVPVFLSTISGYLLGQDIQPSTTSHRVKLMVQDTQSCSVLPTNGSQHKLPNCLQ